MSDEPDFKINSFYSTVLREIENETVQELEPDLYPTISEFFGRLKSEEYDTIEAKIKKELISITANLTRILLTNRLEKAKGSDPINYSNLLDEEKYILDSEEELRERKEMILSATVNGKFKLLESVSDKHKSKTVVVRFLEKTDQIVGVNMEKYGPFQTEDVATIPYENAQALITKKIASKVNWED